MLVFGLLGDKRVARSLSPRMHNAMLVRHGLDGVYVPIAVEPAQVKQVVRAFRNTSLAGVNVTVPHKETVAPLLDSLSPQARLLGAVNTIVFREAELVGYNTDVDGFTEALKEVGFSPRGHSALVFGAGGAARAVVLALVTAGAAEVKVASRTPARTRRLAADLGARAVELAGAPAVSAACDLVVNATPVSTRRESPEMAELALRLKLGQGCRLVVDINYGRRLTFWEEAARAQGMPFLDGLVMLAHQARLSFKLWTGVDAPVEEFASALKGL
jgi:shikimate dehydrogenase